MKNEKETFNGVGISWLVEANNKRLHIFEETQGVQEELFVDTAWSLLQFKNDSGEYKESHFYYAARRPIQKIGLPFTNFNFIQNGNSKQISIIVDGEPVRLNGILRFGFYARTDGGTLVVSLYPVLEYDARPLVMLMSGKKKINTVLQHLAVNWLCEIIPDIAK